MSHSTIASEFHSAFSDFIMELYEQFPGELDLLKAQVYVSTAISPEDLIATFIQHILPHKKNIKDRDDKFFLEKVGHMFNSSIGRVNHFRNIWRSSTLDDEDREILWQWFDSFVLMAERYGKLRSQAC